VNTRVKQQEIRKQEMAIIKVKGAISRVFYEGKGIELTESFQSKAGETIEKRYTVWLTQPTSFEVGDTLQVEGLFNAQIEKWVNQDGTPKLNQNGEPGQTLKLIINNPKIVPAEPLSAIKEIFEPTHRESLPF
jgi:hypothetical protein